MISQPAQPATAVRTSPARRPLTPGTIAIYVVLGLGAAISIFPFLYMISTSLKTYGSMVSGNLWPWSPLGTEAVQWVNYSDTVKEVGWDQSWQMYLLFRYAINSVIVVALTVVGVLITSVLAAYAFAQMRFPGKGVLFLVLLATIMIPGDLTLVPKAVMMYKLPNPFGSGSWYNTYLALTVPFLANVVGIFLLRQFFMQIPRDLFDASLIDGAGHLRYLINVVLPLSKPAVVVVALLNFISAWDSFKWPLLVTRDSSMRVLAVGLQQFVSAEGGTKIHLMMAFSTMVVVPVLILYFFTQQYFTEGVATTGIKG